MINVTGAFLIREYTLYYKKGGKEKYVKPFRVYTAFPIPIKL